MKAQELPVVHACTGCGRRGREHVWGERQLQLAQGRGPRSCMPVVKPRQCPSTASTACTAPAGHVPQSGGTAGRRAGAPGGGHPGRAQQHRHLPHLPEPGAHLALFGALGRRQVALVGEGRVGGEVWWAPCQKGLFEAWPVRVLRSRDGIMLVWEGALACLHVGILTNGWSRWLLREWNLFPTYPMQVAAAHQVLKRVAEGRTAALGPEHHETVSSLR